MQQGDEKNDGHNDRQLILHEIVHDLDACGFGGENRVAGAGAKLNRTGTGDNGGNRGAATAKTGKQRVKRRHQQQTQSGGAADKQRQELTQ